MQENCYCKFCNGLITFVRTAAGKSMPCDSTRVDFVEYAGGVNRVLTVDGRVARGHILKGPSENSVKAYVPHFSTCPYSDEIPRGGRRQGGRMSPTSMSGTGADRAAGAKELGIRNEELGIRSSGNGALGADRAGVGAAGVPGGVAAAADRAAGGAVGAAVGAAGAGARGAGSGVAAGSGAAAGSGVAADPGWEQLSLFPRLRPRLCELSPEELAAFKGASL